MVRVITVKPKDMSEETIKTRLDSLKQEIKDNESEIKELEDELERRKQEVPLGVPLPEKDGAPFVGVYELGFPSEKSFFTFSNRFQNYVTATRDNTKGEPIDIEALLPFLRKGWVAMDRRGNWFWYKDKPIKDKGFWRPIGVLVDEMRHFNLKPAKKWETSLMECGL